MNLSQLIKDASETYLSPDLSPLSWSDEVGVDQLERSINRITDDSRVVDSHTVFVATKVGEAFLTGALQRDPAAVLCKPDHLQQLQKKGNGGRYDTTVLVTEDPLLWQGAFCSTLFKHPSRKIYLSGVTGTNGKTTVTWILYHLWKTMGIPAGMIGTLGARWTTSGGEQHEIKTGYTTPRSFELNEILSRMIHDGVGHVALEVSSEALALGRLKGISFSAAGFTNLSPDHLDYHGTMEDYFQSKMELIHQTAENLKRSDKSSGGRIVIHRLDDFTRRAFEETKGIFPAVIGLNREGDGMDCSLPGRFNRYNAAMAFYLSGMSDSRAEDLKAALLQIPDVPGRFNLLAWRKPGQAQIDPVISGSLLPPRCAIVDYAHTPDALKNVLQEIRNSGACTIVTVFGCGGDRDRKKRPLMGEISSQWSDVTIITDDNPRGEDPQAIRNEILEGIVTLRENVIDVADRRRAIREGIHRIQKLRDSDLPAVLLIAGKGHENVQITGKNRLAFYDPHVFSEELSLVISTES